EKGHFGLFRSFAQLRNTARGARLVLVGDGPLRAELEARVRELGISDSVEFRGAASEEGVLATVASCDVFALPSLMEGLPLTLVEAMSLGVPVVAPRVAGVPELVSDERDGLLFHPSDWDGLAAALLRLASDSALRERLGAAGRARVSQDFAI